jgi:hypothetical protein
MGELRTTIRAPVGMTQSSGRFGWLLAGDLQQRRPLYRLLSEAIADIVYRLDQARESLTVVRPEETQLVTHGGEIAGPNADEADLSLSQPSPV